MSTESASPASSGAVARPPDFLLNSEEKSAARRRAGEPDIYLSWGGEVYGPAGTEEVLAGLRAAWFEEDATFWFEGQDGWLPIADFPSVDLMPSRPAPAESLPSETIPGHAPEPQPATRSRRRGNARKPKSARRPRLGGRGVVIVLAFVVLAVSFTVGILLLLMQV